MRTNQMALISPRLEKMAYPAQIRRGRHAIGPPATGLSSYLLFDKGEDRMIHRDRELKAHN